MSLPQYNSDYSSKDYWEERYANEAAIESDTQEANGPFFEWFSSNHEEIMKELHNTIQSHFGTISDLHILIEGCGNSKVGQDLVDLGYNHITNIDYSETVISSMKKYYNDLGISRYKECMDWLVQDIRTMDLLSDATFDFVIDKSTLDVFFCRPSVDIWHPDSRVTIPVLETLTQVQRVLKPNGVFLYVSFGQPQFRRPLLQQAPLGWKSFCIAELGNGYPYFLYKAYMP